MVEFSQDTYRPQTDNRESGCAILILTADNTEDLEFFYPYYRFTEAGYKVDVATPRGGAFKGKQGLGLKETLQLSSIDPEQYQMLYIPGGKAPSELKTNKGAITLAKRFVAEDKIVAAICHGPQLLAAADVINGRHVAAWPEVENELREAGATYVNQETVVDGLFVTARWPGDLPAHLKETLALLAKVSTKKPDQVAA